MDAHLEKIRTRLERVHQDVVEELEESSVRAEVAEAEKAAGMPVAYLPPTHFGRSAAPAVLLWGALFGALPHGPRAMLKRARLAQAGTLCLEYTGERLGQDDLDVFLALLHLGQGTEIGKPVLFAGADLLGALGLQDSGGTPLRAEGAAVGGRDGARDRLEASMRRLSGALVELRGEGGELAMEHLLHSARRGKDGEAWRVVLAPDLARAFRSGIAGVDMRQRQLLRGKSLAQWLHAWLAGHQGRPHATRLAELQRLSGSSAQPKEFRRVLERALLALEQVVAASGARLEWAIDAGTLRARVHKRQVGVGCDAAK